LLGAGADGAVAVEDETVMMLFLESCKLAIKVSELGLFVRSRDALIILNFYALAK
jgi:hypothetical protein